MKPIVDLNAMPTSNGEVIGREKEVQWLNEAWDNPQTRVVSVIAWGGVGKTSLINHWLNSMSERDFAGAERVFAHSFYSQGTSDQRYVSAEHFINEAFRFLKYNGPIPTTIHDKGLLLAELFCQKPTLLVLDGLEPMQHPLEVLNGKLKDSALEALIKQLAYNLEGLCVITSRVPVYELQNRGFNNYEHQLQRLTVEAGVKVIKNLGTTGPKQDMENAVKQVHGHALTLSLLGRYLAVACDGDIRRRDNIPNLIDEPTEGKHAQHVMRSYQIWLQQSDNSEDLNLLFVIALFDRPVEFATITALLAGAPIDGVTDKLQGYNQAKLKFAMARLAKLQLIAKPEANTTTLDCHPLVREHFAAELQQHNATGYQQAHARLYDYYKNLPEQELPDTLEQMQPLFNAVSHGCKAGLHQQALDEVYWPRIRREQQAYIVRKLGAFATNLACITNFFTDDGWTQPAKGLTKKYQGAVLNWAAFALRGLGRLNEALAPFLAGILIADWQGAANNASNASELYLTLGQIDNAIHYGQLSVEYIDKTDNKFWQMLHRTTYADALLHSGPIDSRLQQAQALFIEAERRQQEFQPQYPYLYSVQGYRYCQLLLTQQSPQQVIERVETTLSWVKNAGDLLSIALDQLTLGKAHLQQAIEDASHLTQAQQYLEQAVAGLREAGHFDYISHGLLIRAAYYAMNNQYQSAWQDLDEALEIASFGDMQLHLCDYHLEVCRNLSDQLAYQSQFEQHEFVVIENGITNHPSEQQVKDKFLHHYDIAKQMISEIGYHWRDDELEEIEELLASI